MKLGDVVKLKRGVCHPSTIPEGRKNHRTAKIIAELDSFSEGAVKLDRDLCGMIYWNKDVLENVK